MKIALLLNAFSPSGQSIALMLKRLGHELHAVDFQYREGMCVAESSEAAGQFVAEIDGLHWIETGSRSPLSEFSAAPKLGRILGDIQPDVLVSLSADSYGRLAWASGFVPYAIYAMGSDILLMNNPITRMITRRALRKASAIFANGEYLAQKTRELAPGANVKSLLIGVDPTEFRPSVPDSKILLLNNRSFRGPNNNRFIIEAFALLRNIPDFEFHFASDGPLLQETKILARRRLPSEILERFKFWGGVSEYQMIDLLHRSRYFVSTSLSDGTSRALMEAMACGLYPILSDIPQNRDWIDPFSRRNGMLVPMDDPGHLATALNLALHKPELADRARPLNRCLIEQRANSHHQSARLSSFLEAITRNAAPASSPLRHFNLIT